MIRRVALVRNDVSEGHIGYVPSVTITPMIESTRSSETSVLTRATRRNMPDDTFFVVTTVKSLNLTYYIMSYACGIYCDIFRKSCFCIGFQTQKQYGNFLVTGFPKHIIAVTDRLKKRNLWKEVFIGRSYWTCSGGISVQESRRWKTVRDAREWKRTQMNPRLRESTTEAGKLEERPAPEG
jgi:hypothetical protein